MRRVPFYFISHGISKAGVHHSKCTPAEILTLPTVSAFLLVLLLL